MYAVGDRVLVCSALAFGEITEVHKLKTGCYYVVHLPKGGDCWRHESELLPVPKDSDAR
jgi:hypothetical protein